MELAVFVQPSARADMVVGVHDGMLKVRVAAPAESGRANRALCALIGRELGVRPARVTVVAGTANRRKRVKVQGVDAGAVAARLVP